MRELLSQLDGSRASRVAMLAGMTREELEAVSGGRRTTSDGRVGQARISLCSSIGEARILVV